MLPNLSNSMHLNMQLADPDGQLLRHTGFYCYMSADVMILGVGLTSG